MIRHLLLTLLCVSILSLTAFSDDVAKVAESQAAWTKLRDKCGGDYSYSKRWSSFAGFGNETTIVVNDNNVVERRYREFSNRPMLPGEKPDAGGKDWVEKGDALGSHKLGAHPAKTLDELYTEAIEIAKRELAEFEKRYVRVDKNGLLLGCYIIDTRIADDAPIKGVTISSITLGETQNIKNDDKTESADPKPVYRSPNGMAFPAAWGAPPRIQTKDLRPLPGGYGRGSSTLAQWIQKNLDAEE